MMVSKLIPHQIIINHPIPTQYNTIQYNPTSNTQSIAGDVKKCVKQSLQIESHPWCQIQLNLPSPNLTPSTDSQSRAERPQPQL